MSAITVNHLNKTYKSYRKDPGFFGSVRSLVKRKYENIPAVKDISFTIESGELVGFIGPNGAGKTTTLKCLSGLLFPTSGEISVLGFKPFERKNEFFKTNFSCHGAKKSALVGSSSHGNIFTE